MFFPLSGNISTILSITTPTNPSRNLDFYLSLNFYIETENHSNFVSVFSWLSCSFSLFLFPLWPFQPSSSVISPWHKLFIANRTESKFLFFFFLICSKFCHTLKWNGLEFTCLHHPDPPSHLPLHPLPPGLPRAPGPSACLMHPTWAGDLFHPW